MERGSAPVVSLLIPARNEERFISDCLRSILLNDFPREDYEILLVDGMSTDRTVEIASALCPADVTLRVIANEKVLIPAALNAGLSAARGRLLMRMDAHADYSTDYIRRCVELLDGSGAENVGGVVMSVSKSNTLISRTIAAVLSEAAAVGNSTFRVGAGALSLVDTVFGGCYRTATLRKLGGYDESVHFSEDYLMNLRLRKSGGTILLDPRIVCRYYPRDTLASFLKQTARNGFWTIYPLTLVRDYRPAARHLAPLAFVAAGAVLACSALTLGGMAAAFFAAAAIIYGLYAGLLGLRVARRIGAQYFFSSIAIVVLLHVVYGLGSLVGAAVLSVRCIPARRSHVSAKMSSY